MSDITTMAEVAPLLEKGTLLSEAEFADRRQKSAHKSLMSILLIAFFHFPLNLAVGYFAMNVDIHALATPPKYNAYGNITRSGLCGIGGDQNLGIDLPGPACAFTAGNGNSAGPKPFQYFVPIGGVTACNQCTQGEIIPFYYSCYLHDCADSDAGTPCAYATCK